MKTTIKLMGTVAVLGLLVMLQACSDNAKRSYELTVTNLTNNQPLSPLAVILHGIAYQDNLPGAVATTGLEVIAESGDNSTLISEAEDSDVVGLTATSAGIIAPGKSATVILSNVSGSLLLSLFTMLVNTNDAYAAVYGIDLSALTLNGEMSLLAPAYDAGTEGNSEAMADIPGPAAGGEGFNVARDDRDFITVHGGVISQNDGLSSSVLDESHRFDNPVVLIKIVRTQ